MNATLTQGTARTGERAYVTKWSARHGTYIRPSTDLRDGAKVWRVLVDFTPRDGRDFTHSTAFRQRRHAATWHAALTRKES